MVLDEQQQVQRILTDYFVTASEKNSSFSLRAFSAKLGISSSALSEIMRGKRKVSEKKAMQFADTLNASQEQISQLKNLFDSRKKIESLSKLSNPFREIILKEDEFDLLADWRYFGLVALMRTKPFYSDPTWIANRLSLPLNEVQFIIQKLLDLKIINRDTGGNLTEDKCCFRTPENYPDDMIRGRQIEGLTTAIESIQKKDKRQLGCYSTISTDPERIAVAMNMMEEFLKKLSIYLHEGEPSEVFELHIQLFPRTTPKENLYAVV